MSHRSVKGRLSFQAKVLIPVIALLVLLPALTLAIIHRSSMDHLLKEAAAQLKTADALFQKSLADRAKNTIFRFKSIVKEPRTRAAAQTRHGPTITEHLHSLLDENDGVEFMLFIAEDGSRIGGARRGRTGSLDDFELVAQPALEQALTGQPDSTVGTLGGFVFTAVAVPVLFNDMLIGVLTVGERVGPSSLQELTAYTQAEIILLSDLGVAASTLKNSESTSELVSTWKRIEQKGPLGTIQPALIDETHFLALVAKFPAARAGDDLRYILLFSYERALQQLRETQAALWLLSSVGIAVSALVIWLVIGRITAPLRQLRTSADAVGSGDFSKRVNIRSNDEFGQLGNAFNQMTRNLQHSHSELQKTVQTLKATQAQLIQSEKLSAVGEFVAGIAHELNNPLTSVIGFAELLKGANLQPKHQNFLAYIVKSSERCHKIVQGLLSFARQHPPERKVVNVNDLVEGVLELLAYEMRTSNISVEREFQPNLPRLVGDSHQLQQVFLNIANNARQAMEAHQPSGKLRITTESNGDKVRIIFEDNGPGISKENLRKIFDPFFTTKPVGKGTGLGLSLCYGIINEHGGTITADSQPQNGATFVIELPAYHDPVQAQDNAAGCDPVANGLQGSGRRVLVVDDEEWILELVRQILKRDGFVVDTAKNGELAVEQVSKARYELVVCDWKMPGLSGPQLYERIFSTNQEAAERMIYMTGDVVSDTFQAFLKQHRKTCLSKPFSVAEFRQTIQKFVGSLN